MIILCGGGGGTGIKCCIFVSGNIVRSCRFVSRLLFRTDMELQTKIEIEPSGLRMDYDSRMMLLGSCFAENIGKKLKQFRFPVELNPCGIVYNPASVANVLNLLLEKRLFTGEELLENGGRWVSLWHHGSFSSPDKETCLKNINRRLEPAAVYLEKTDVLLITWGTSWVYRYLESGVIAANCHKFPAPAFERFRLSVADIVKEYAELIPRLLRQNPRLKIIFTVSPIRHWKDGAHGNQLSKATLLLAIEELSRQFSCVGYFPSYEIVMDELRDYRFYAEDMLHVSEQAVEYIWERFADSYLSPEARDLMTRIDKVNRGLAHRPFDGDSEAYRNFMERLRQEMEAIRALCQNVDFSSVDSSASVC